MRPLWDEQFAETREEREDRWRAIRARRRAEGKCWQCAKPVAECSCPNVKHPTPPAAPGRG